MIRERSRSSRGRVAAITVRHDDVGLPGLKDQNDYSVVRLCVQLKADSD